MRVGQKNNNEMSREETQDCRKRLVKSKSGLRIISYDGSSTSPFELTEPPWTPDKESSCCAKCQADFDLLTRRHHCRRCGHLYCSRCCEQKIPLPRMCFVDPVRLCDACAEVTLKENEFYDKHLKILLGGANFLLNVTDNMGNVTSVSILSHLSSDHSTILFDGGSAWEQSPIRLPQIQSFKVIGSTNSLGNSDISGAVVTYKGLEQEESVTLTVAPVPNRKQSVAWISAMQKGLKLLSESSEEA